MDAEAETEPQVDTPPVAEQAPESTRIPPPPPHAADRASQTQQIFPPEYFTRRPYQATDVQTRRFWTGVGIWAVGFVLAFWLSWSTNSNWNRGVFAKLSYGIGAGKSDGQDNAASQTKTPPGVGTRLVPSTHNRNPDGAMRPTNMGETPRGTSRGERLEDQSKKKEAADVQAGIQMAPETRVPAQWVFYILDERAGHGRRHQETVG
ncbi:hypothetical protein ABBQ32_011339 [Trebouxia sp. C0010 RCD-2024]